MSNKATPSDIGARIKLAREANSYTLEQVAKAIGVSASTVLRYETGAFERLKLPVLYSLAHALHVSPNFLACKDDSDPEDLQLLIADISKRKDDEPAVVDGKPLDEQDLKLLRMLRSMSPEDKDSLASPLDRAGVNILRLAGRDGTFIERELTDDQLRALQAIIQQMPDVTDL